MGYSADCSVQSLAGANVRVPLAPSLVALKRASRDNIAVMQSLNWSVIATNNFPVQQAYTIHFRNLTRLGINLYERITYEWRNSKTQWRISENRSDQSGARA